MTSNESIPAHFANQWIERGYSRALYTDWTGKVIGEVNDLIGGETAAIVGGKKIGDYAYQTQARAAVEKACQS